MKTKKNILLVLNPVAGNSDKRPVLNAFQKETDRRDLEPCIYKTTGKDDRQAITDLIEEKKPERIVVAGGDGTIREVAEILQEYDIPLGIIPAGSANGLAVNLDLPETREEQFKIALGDDFMVMDMLTINDKTCLHISDLGVNAELIRNYEKSKIRGKLGYLLQTIPTLFTCDYPFQFEIEANGKTIEDEGILVAIANANKFGTGANINPTGKMNDGKFEVLIFRDFNISEILKTFYSDMNLKRDFVEVISTDKATIHCKKKTPFQIDGEFIGDETKVTASLCPQPLKIAVPGTRASKAT